MNELNVVNTWRK